MLKFGQSSTAFNHSSSGLGWLRRGNGRRANCGCALATAMGVVVVTTTVEASAAPAGIPQQTPVSSASGASPFGLPLTFDAFDRNRDAPNEQPNYHSDGVYGRFDGELALVPSVGMQYATAGWFTQLGISAFYLSTIGIVFHVSDGRWSPISKRADFNVSTLGLALRPLFLLRWTQDWERGPSLLDLTIDSLTLSVGSYWSQQHSLDLQRYGLETELSIGFPLLAKAHGPWLTANIVNRLPRVTHVDHRVDLAYGLRFEWSFSLGG